jgi:hypothetical protein
MWGGSSVRNFTQTGRYSKCTLLGYYAASNGNPLLTFRDNVSVPYSRVKMGPIRCPETPVKDYHSMLRVIPWKGAVRFNIAAEASNHRKRRVYSRR